MSGAEPHQARTSERSANGRVRSSHLLELAVQVRRQVAATELRVQLAAHPGEQLQRARALRGKPRGLACGTRVRRGGRARGLGRTWWCCARARASEDARACTRCWTRPAGVTRRKQQLEHCRVGRVAATGELGAELPSKGREVSRHTAGASLRARAVRHVAIAHQRRRDALRKLPGEREQLRP